MASTQCGATPCRRESSARSPGNQRVQRRVKPRAQWRGPRQRYLVVLLAAFNAAESEFFVAAVQVAAARRRATDASPLAVIPKDPSVQRARPLAINESRTWLGTRRSAASLLSGPRLIASSHCI